MGGEQSVTKREVVRVADSEDEATGGGADRSRGGGGGGGAGVHYGQSDRGGGGGGAGVHYGQSARGGGSAVTRVGAEGRYGGAMSADGFQGRDRWGNTFMALFPHRCRALDVCSTFSLNPKP